MATTMQNFPKILKMLRENSNMKEKRKALTYISSNARKLDSTGVIKEDQYKELCKLVIEIFTNTEQDAHYEAYSALSTIIQDFKDHKLNLFESLLQTNRKNRLKIIKLLEILEDSAISSAAKDVMTMNFFNDCMHTVQSHTMEWSTSTTAADNKDAASEGDTQSLSDEEKLEEELINYAVALLRRLYKLADKTTDQTIHRFDTLLMDKIVTLAYLGNKRQRGTALKLLKEAVTTNFATRIRTNHADVWSQYKSTLQSVYCKRMLLLVGSCDIDWATQWNISIQFLGTDLHHGASLINNLLSVEERAFKSTDSIIRRQAFLSWKLLVDNFALDPQELATARRIKLLCIPLNAKNSKTELIALTKLEVWWHLIIKLYKDIFKFVNPVITQFLNFCFGPLGDTPLLSTKFDVVASPGKRFSKTKVVAIDALRQLLVPKQESHTDFTGVLEERLPYSISNAVFQECYKSIIHSVGEALLVLSQLTDKDMKNRSHIGKTLWVSLINYIKDAKTEIKNLLYKDIVLLIIELLNHATSKPLINDLIMNLILPELVKVFTDVQFNDDTVADLVLKLISTETFLEMESIHCDAIKTLLTYHSNTPNLLGQIAEKMQSITVTDKSRSVVSEMWCILADIITKYMEGGGNVNEGNMEEPKFSSLQSILSVPFTQCLVDDTKQTHTIVKMWRTVYKQFESIADSLATNRSNEIVFKTADMIQSSLKNDKKCCYLAVQCVDVLLSTVNYKILSGKHDVPSIVTLIVDLCLQSLNEARENEAEIALKAQSTLLINAFGHDPGTAVPYLCASKPVIELMLTNSSSSLCKEITNTWETVVSIFKGLNKLLTHDLLSMFEEIILQAANHSNTDIQRQAFSILEIREGLQDSAKSLLEEIQTKVKQDKELLKSDRSKKTQSSDKMSMPEHSVRRYFSRINEAPKAIHKKQTNKDEKKVPHSLDSDTEEYVLIKTDLNFDVNRLTENQKESLKRRRDDIPAMCNDLSQSSSQDTQQLREWFSTKNKFIDAVNKSDATKKDNIERNENIDHDANKENKLKAKEVVSTGTENPLSTVNEAKNGNDAAQIALNNSISDTNDITKTVDKVMSEGMMKDADITDDNTEVTKIMTESVSDKTLDVAHPSKLVGTRLDFESRDEFPEENYCERSESPSVLDSSRRRNRITRKFVAATTGSDESTRNEESLSKDAGGSKRTLRGKSEQNKPFVKESLVINEIKRGLKRKSASDSETDVGMHLRRRRKLSNGSEVSTADSHHIKSAENKILSPEMVRTLDNESLSEKSKKEIMRLQINMVFDSPLPKRRRSKLPDESNKGTEATAEKTPNPSPENKGAKLKLADVRSAEQMKDLKKVSKNLEKDAKPTAAQPISTRRKRRSLRQETDKNDDFPEGADDKSSDTKENGSNVEYADTGSSTCDSSPEVEDCVNRDIDSPNPGMLENDSTPPDDLGKEKELHKTDPQPTKEKPTNQDDGEDIIENSQEYTKTSKVEKKQTDKQCVVAMEKVDSTRATNGDEVTAVATDVPECNLTDKSSDLEDPKIDTVESHSTQVIQIDKTDTAGDTQVDISQDTCSSQQEDGKTSLIESSQKSNETNTLSKSVSIISQSPKSNPKRYPKLKAYPTGRAAHMLGLVTKQGLLENDGAIIRIDDEMSSKKVKSRDIENESGKKEKLPVIKEVEKIGGPCGSRQEKIFSNMRSTDFNSSSPIKLFSNLKNDGEKMSSKVEKRMSDTPTIGEQGSGKENDDNLSPLHEKDDLPMLEWSSANPPSLTASPSASILKRNRAVVPEPDTDSTPNKRKRVSFADPPVSKEMGYEITNTGSPHKINKLSTPRAFLFRKDSPLRLRQNKLKFIQIDPERTEKENDTQEDSTSEVDLQCERENELLSKIAEELEYTENMSMDVEPSTSCNYMDIESMSEDPEASQGTKVSVQSLDDELGIKESTMSRSESDVTKNMKNNTSISPEAEESDTQQDIFSCAEEKNLREISDNSISKLGEDKDITSPGNVSIDQIRMSVTNDSIIAPHDDSHLETLEDTVDVQNVTNLNFTANCEEMFSGKLIRTSTQAAESTAEEDTLPVTDSMVVSQDSEQIIQADTDVYHSEPANSVRPIFASLISSNDPIACIIRQLVSPSSVDYLSTYFANKGLRTVGDLAQLSEREISKLPVKGQLKVDVVKSVLQRFESTRSAHQLVPSGGTPVLKNKILLETSEGLNNSVNLNDSVVNANDNTKSVGNISELNSSVKLDKMITMNSITCSKSSTDILEARQCETSSPKTYGNGRLSQVKPTLSTTTNISNLTADRMLSMPTCSTSSVLENTRERSLKTTGTITDPVCVSTRKATKSVASQMALEDLLDEVDVNLVLESAVRRCNPQHILSEYKSKMRHMPEAELGRETLRMIGIENTASCSDVTLKSVCRACGVNKVLLRLPDIFSTDKEFFVKVFKAYRQKISARDCLDVYDSNELKEAICQKCTSSELVQILSKRLKEDEGQGIRTPMAELPSLNAMLKRMPMDVIISHTVANDELIPSQVVLDIALQNNTPEDIMHALESRSPMVTKYTFDKLWTPQTVTKYIQDKVNDREALLDLYKAVSAKLSMQDLINASHESMRQKVETIKEEK